MPSSADVEIKRLLKVLAEQGGDPKRCGFSVTRVVTTTYTINPAPAEKPDASTEESLTEWDNLQP